MRLRRLTGNVVLLILLPTLLLAQSGESAGADRRGMGIGFMMPPMPGDVLTPDLHGNTPNIKVALKFGVNRAAYTNDRFPDNRPFDVGTVFGEADVYGAAAGFGSQVGIEIEFPQNTIFSWVASARYDHLIFDNSGKVQDVCVDADGDSVGVTSEHTFDANIDYLMFAGAAKLNFREFYLLGGLAIETPLDNSVRFNRQHDGKRCFYPEARDIRNSLTPVEIPEISSLHFSIRIGGGLNYQLSKHIQFSPELTLDFGMNALNKSPESDLGTYALDAVFRFDI